MIATIAIWVTIMTMAPTYSAAPGAGAGAGWFSVGCSVAAAAIVRASRYGSGAQQADRHRAGGQVGNGGEQEWTRQGRNPDRGDLPTFALLAMQFHRAFVELTNNGIMLSCYDRLQDRQYLSIVRSAPTVIQDPDRVMAEHRLQLADAQSGDGVAFALHLRAHQSHGHDLE